MSAKHQTIPKVILLPTLATTHPIASHDFEDLPHHVVNRPLWFRGLNWWYSFQFILKLLPRTVKHFLKCRLFDLPVCERLIYIADQFERSFLRRALRLKLAERRLQVRWFQVQ